MSVFKKICNCSHDSAFYFDFGMYKCQYCDGILTDLNRVKKIIQENTPVNLKNRNLIIEKKINIHKKLLNDITKLSNK